MQELFNKIGKAASNVATSATIKAEELRAVNKIKNEENELRSEYSATKKKMAEYVFKQYQAGELKDEALKEFCDKMQTLRDDIERLEEEVKAVKEEYAEKAAERAERRL